MKYNKTSEAVEMMADKARTYKGDDGQEFVAMAICLKYQRMEEALKEISDPQNYEAAHGIYQLWKGSNELHVWEFAQEAISYDPLSPSNQ